MGLYLGEPSFCSQSRLRLYMVLDSPASVLPDTFGVLWVPCVERFASPTRAPDEDP
jgi:hypothetical protein